MKKREVANVCFELVEDPAPEQFSEKNDPMMVYQIKINNELVCSTNEGTSLKDMVKVCKTAAKFFEKAAKKLAKKKQIGKRCT